MIKQFGFLFSLLFITVQADTPMPFPTKPLGQSIPNFNDSERMTFDSVVFSNNMTKLPEEFCKHVIESAPAELQGKIKILLIAKKDDNIVRKILLYGAAGSGKTTLARVILQQMNIPYLFVKAPMLANEYKNSGAAGLSRIAKAAVALNAAVIIDELDCISKKIGTDTKSGEDNTPKALGLLIDELISHKILFIGTANDIQEMPEPLQSRLKGALFNLPKSNHVSGKVKIINECLKGRAIDAQETIILFANQVDEIATRDIETIVDLAYESAFLRNSSNPIIVYQDLKIAFDSLRKNEGALKKTGFKINWSYVTQGASMALDVGRLILALKGHGSPNWAKEGSFKLPANLSASRNLLTNMLK